MTFAAFLLERGCIELLYGSGADPASKLQLQMFLEVQGATPERRSIALSLWDDYAARQRRQEPEPEDWRQRVYGAARAVR